jgi:hypothetical protein
MALPSGISGRSIFFCFSVPYIILTMKDINNLWNIYLQKCAFLYQ